VLHIANYEKWARFIAYPQLPPDHLQRIRTLVQQIRALAATQLQLAPELVRANIFVPSANVLRMVHGAWDNMTWAPEHELALETDHGSAGRAFTDGTPFSIRRRGAGWTAGTLPGPQQARLNPRLQWVLSLPIGRIVRTPCTRPAWTPPTGEDGPAREGLTIAREILGVLNIDGLDTVPPMLQTPGDSRLKTLVFALWAATERIRESLALANLGEPLHDD